MFHLEILKKKKHFYWRLRGKNYRILCHSECYTTKVQCKKTAKLIWANLRNCKLEEVQYAKRNGT